MKLCMRVTLLGTLLVAGQPTWAAVIAGTPAASVQFGSLGVGGDLSLPLADDQWALDLSVQGLGVGHGLNSGGVDYTGRMRLLSIGAIGQYAPWRGFFHVDGGVYLDRNRLNLAGQGSAAGYIVNGVSYSSTQLTDLSASAATRTLAPYVGMGWGGMDRTSGLHYFGRVGVLYQGAPRVDLLGVSPYATGSAPYNALYGNLLAQQMQISHDLGSSLRWYPVMAIGAQYRF